MPHRAPQAALDWPSAGAGSWEDIMLVLSRKVGERILIGNEISVTIVRITGGGVRIGIEAPPDTTVLRAEIKEEPPLATGAASSDAPLARKPR